ncbi:DUF4263 domain-containing protein [Agrobacterium sp. SHOUNA12C]|nr:DUF4263 domain-containing protein [Agrobacterium sp. SHOUNA12C]
MTLMVIEDDVYGQNEMESENGSFDDIAVHMSMLDHPSFRLTFSVTPSAMERAKFRDREFEPPAVDTLLAHFQADEERLVLYPTITSPDNSRFLEPKYGIRSITLEKQKSVTFREGSRGSIDELPSGFIHDPHQGFGVLPKNRLIIQAIGLIRGIDNLILTDEKNKRSIVGSSFVMSYSEFDRHRRAIQRSHSAAIKIANADKAAYLYNQLVSPIDPETYPPKPMPFQKDALHRAVGNGLSAPGQLSRSDQRAAVRIVKTEVKAIAEKDQTELLELSREIEVVSLEMIIEKMTAMMEKDHAESVWQKFLSKNPFILRLAFGLPIMVFGEQVAVGGVRFENKGGKLADFVVKTGAFGNLAIVEIKTTSTVLIEPKHYRLGLHAPTKELSGGVNQVLDQRYMLSREIDTRKVNAQEYEVWTYAVKCFVIAGRTITDPNNLLQEAKRKSFEFYRHNLVDVTVLTFDELLEKLRALLLFLKPAELAGSDETTPTS